MHKSWNPGIIVFEVYETASPLKKLYEIFYFIITKWYMISSIHGKILERNLYVITGYFVYNAITVLKLLNCFIKYLQSVQR